MTDMAAKEALERAKNHLFLERTWTLREHKLGFTVQLRCWADSAKPERSPLFGASVGGWHWTAYINVFERCPVFPLFLKNLEPDGYFSFDLIDLHGGCTFAQKSLSQGQGEKEGEIKVGCDFQHYGDNYNQYYDIEEVPYIKQCWEKMFTDLYTLCLNKTDEETYEILTEGSKPELSIPSNVIASEEPDVGKLDSSFPERRMPNG